MNFIDAVKTCLRKYVDFTGRARRSEFWWFVLFTTVVGAALRYVGPTYEVETLGVVQEDSVLAQVWSVALVVPLLAAGARRLHDTGRSGWWQLLDLIPIIGWIVLIVWQARDGDPRTTAYGPDPKGRGAAETYGSFGGGGIGYGGYPTAPQGEGYRGPSVLPPQ